MRSTVHKAWGSVSAISTVSSLHKSLIEDFVVLPDGVELIKTGSKVAVKFCVAARDVDKFCFSQKITKIILQLRLDKSHNRLNKSDYGISIDRKTIES